MRRKPHASKLNPANRSLDGESSRVESAELRPRRMSPTPVKDESKQEKASSAYKSFGQVRRSERLQSSVSSPQNQNADCVIRELVVKENKVAGENRSPVEPNEKQLEVKIDDPPAQPMEAEPEVKETSEDTGLGRMTYQRLYIEANRKIEDLMDENHKLRLELERVRGKIEGYEKFARDVETFKTVTSNLTKLAAKIGSAFQTEEHEDEAGAESPTENKSAVKRKRGNKAAKKI